MRTFSYVFGVFTEGTRRLAGVDHSAVVGVPVGLGEASQILGDDDVVEGGIAIQRAMDRLQLEQGKIGAELDR